jgi:type IV secretory pathway TraG/TraD family ATPase VirD4
VLLALDEVANIAPIRSLPRLLSEGIQQGIVPVLGVQDMSQAHARWGEHETATMWSTPALRLVLAGVADPYTAQLVSDACGEQLVWRPQISENNSTSHQVERPGRTYTGGDSHSYSQQRERTIQPADLRAMPPDAHSHYHKAENPSESTSSTAPLDSQTATGKHSAGTAANDYVNRFDGT